MSVAKLLLVSIMIAAFTAANCPPASPDATERIMTSWFDYLLRSRVRGFLWLQTPLVFGIAEALALTASLLSRTPASAFLLRHLAPRNTTNTLRTTPLFLLAFALVTSGALLRLWAFRALGPLFTLAASLRRGHRLVTSGPYAHVRHPSYTGYLLMFLGLLAWYGARGSWVRAAGVLRSARGRAAVVAVGAVGAATFMGGLRRIPQEDALMRREFGREWSEWVQRTPYLLIPGVV